MRSRAKVETEIQVITTAINNLKAHAVELMNMRTEEAIKGSGGSSSSSSGGGDGNGDELKEKLEEMERKLRKVEVVRGLDARISEVEVSWSDWRMRVGCVLIV
jgi:hypothetical protein